MSRRSELFSRSNIESLPVNNPFLTLFRKEQWMDYLELVARIYDRIEDQGSRVDQGAIAAIIDEFYSHEAQINLAQKRQQFLSMAISELELLKDSHDSAGNRYFDVTREGNELLGICENLIVRRKKFTGSSADALIGALNNLMLQGTALTIEQALSHHEERIVAYKEDMERMIAEGVQASELLSQHVSPEEFLTQADQAASFILNAGEDIKVAIEEARKRLIRAYREQSLNAGQSIEFIAEFHDELRASSEYASYSRAKDLLSYLDSVGTKFKYRDVSELTHLLYQRGMIGETLFRRSALRQFTKQFQRIVSGISAKIQEQMDLLKVQVHYVISGESRRARAELMELLGLFVKHESTVIKFLEESPLSLIKRERPPYGTELGLFSFETTEDISCEAVRENTLADEEIFALLETLRQAEEATIARVLQRLKNLVSRHGAVRLSIHSFEMGIVEYYVLAWIEHFSKEFQSEKLGKIDLSLATKNQSLVLCDVEDKEITFA